MLANFALMYELENSNMSKTYNIVHSHCLLIMKKIHLSQLSLADSYS